MHLFRHSALDAEFSAFFGDIPAKDTGCRDESGVAEISLDQSCYTSLPTNSPPGNPT